ncbi:MAG: zinc dependent phospholipase C family protein, partial [Candidatus Thorarchaeota archaeon]
MDAVLADATAKLKWQDGDSIFWTEKRKICFLIGTEAPDSTDNPEATSFTRLTLNGVRCAGMLVKTVLHYYDNDEDSDDRMRPKNNPSFISKAYEWNYLAKKYLREGKCDAAAFYMGAITHLIADVASWPHTLHHTGVSGSLEPSHPNFEKAVLAYTKDFKKRDQSSTGGFSYPKLFHVKAVEPALAIKLVAFDTRWDYSISHGDYYTKPYPSYVQPGDYPSKKIFDTFKNFYEEEQKEVFEWRHTPWIENRVQESLNNAVKYCAYAINYIADAWAEGDDPKSCQECSGRGKSPEQRRWRKIGVAMSVLVVLGVANGVFIPILQLLSQ